MQRTRVKAAILSVIHDRGTKANVAVVRPHLESKDPHVRAAAVRTLAKSANLRLQQSLKPFSKTMMKTCRQKQSSLF
jgi:hypothetical protein